MAPVSIDAWVLQASAAAQAGVRAAEKSLREWRCCQALLQSCCDEIQRMRGLRADSLEGRIASPARKDEGDEGDDPGELPF
jgi:hypothetical protein